MNFESLETAADAASDLTARLAAELAQATADLDAAERRFFTASAQSFASEHPIPFAIRRERIASRNRVAVLRQVLAGMPNIEEDLHARSA
jgi:hypothetical protein